MNKILKPKYKHFLELDSLQKVKIGQIFWAGRNYNRRNKSSHCFVVIDNGETEGYLYGTMLSSRKDYNYIPIEIKHFKENYSKGKKFEYPCRDRETLFVPKKLIKYEEWAPFYLVGELTLEGLEMIKGVIENMDPEVWRWNKNIEAEKELIKDLSTDLE